MVRSICTLCVEYPLSKIFNDDLEPELAFLCSFKHIIHWMYVLGTVLFFWDPELSLTQSLAHVASSLAEKAKDSDSCE